MTKRVSFFSEKKNLVRGILFLLAVALAIVGITNGVVRYGSKEPGYYAVEVLSESKVVVFDSGVTFMLYADGDSDSIKQRLNEASTAYSRSIERAYKLLDASREYEGYVNIATLNRSLGEETQIGEELFSVLRDALLKTERGSAYSVFAGALYDQWRTILYLENPSDFDPANDADTAERLTAIATRTSRPGQFSLRVTDEEKRTVSFSYTAEYAAFLEEYEIEAPVLDLNVLRDAYLLELVASDMEKQGFSQGYLYTDNGISVMLDRDDIQYGLYSCAERAVVKIGNVPASPRTVFCQLTAFPLTDNQYGYYSVEADGRTLYRHPWMDARTGVCSGSLLCASVVGTGVSPADAVYRILDAVYVGSETDMRSRLQEPDGRYPLTTYTLQTDPYTLHTCGERADSLEMGEDARFRKEVF